MKKLMYLVMTIAMSLFAADASAQYIPVTTPGNCITDGSGSVITAGTMIVVGTDANDNPIPYRAGTSVMSTTAPISRSIVNGALLTSLQLADPASTSPTNVLYRFVIQDNLSKKITVYKQIIVSINDLGTNFNFCKMNPLPFTTQIQFAAAPFSFSGDWNLLGHLSVALSSSFPGGITGTTSLANIIVNPSSTSTGAALTVGGTTSTTGGISIFVGASGSATERLSVVPADGSSAAFRVGALSVRLVSGGLLTGSQVAGLSSTGVLSLSTSTGTLPSTIANDTAGGITFVNNAGGSFQFGNGGTLFLNVLGAGIRFPGATSGTTVIQAAAVAGAGTLTLPSGINATLSCNTCSQTLTATSLSSPIATNLTINSGVSQGSGHKHQRFGTLCTTAAVAGSNCTTAVTWTSAFADSSYTVSCTGVTATNAPVLTVESIAAAGFTVRIFAVVGSAATFSLADCIADHD